MHMIWLAHSTLRICLEDSKAMQIVTGYLRQNSNNNKILKQIVREILKQEIGSYLVSKKHT